VITATYSLENVVEALTFVSSRQAMGKIIVKVNPELK
jgi:hypothetical protein